MKRLASAALLVIGFFAAFYAGFCLLGGPDGAILTRGSLLFGLPSSVIAILLIRASARLVAAKAYVYAPLVVSLLVWLLAIAIAQMAGFYLWLVGTPVAAALALIYWFIVGFSQRQGQRGAE